MNFVLCLKANRAGWLRAQASNAKPKAMEGDFVSRIGL